MYVVSEANKRTYKNGIVLKASSNESQCWRFLSGQILLTQVRRVKSVGGWNSFMEEVPGLRAWGFRGLINVQPFVQFVQQVCTWFSLLLIHPRQLSKPFGQSKALHAQGACAPLWHSAFALQLSAPFCPKVMLLQNFAKLIRMECSQIRKDNDRVHASLEKACVRDCSLWRRLHSVSVPPGYPQHRPLCLFKGCTGFDTTQLSFQVLWMNKYIPF